MANFTQYWASGVMKQAFLTLTIPKPQTLALALTSGVAGSWATGGNCYEIPNAGSYARQILVPLDANWSIGGAANEFIYNNQAFSYPAATADWGWVSGIVVLDSGIYGSGNTYYWGQLTTPKFVQNGDSFSIPISGLSIQHI